MCLSICRSGAHDTLDDGEIGRTKSTRVGQQYATFGRRHVSTDQSGGSEQKSERVKGTELAYFDRFHLVDNARHWDTILLLRRM